MLLSIITYYVTFYAYVLYIVCIRRCFFFCCCYCSKFWCKSFFSFSFSPSICIYTLYVIFIQEWATSANQISPTQIYRSTRFSVSREDDYYYKSVFISIFKYVYEDLNGSTSSFLFCLLLFLFFKIIFYSHIYMHK